MLFVTPGMAQQYPTSELRPPRVQLPTNIQYSEWKKVCFKGSDGATLCRTTSSGTEGTGEVVARVDLIERVGSDAARLQLFIPQGFNLTMGVTATVDQAAPTEFPYNFCLTNICIAADHVSAKLIGELKSGQTLKIGLTDFNSSTVVLNFPLSQFAAAHAGPPSETFDFNIDAVLH
jgi:invasion protein IalB